MELDSLSAIDEQSSSSTPVDEFSEFNDFSNLLQVDNVAPMALVQVATSRGGHAVFMPPWKLDGGPPLPLEEDSG